ncbi:Hypothetical_protein [Hexamita inflata]|uniref:Hypothetical_protein n=1 Tax=Hexamita inflata TaxID=28002 RepID=A0AA86USQ0_9EUKA|nr:Hypothetical protein HINF_LOCUS57855 [Hexamita inflata]
MQILHQSLLSKAVKSVKMRLLKISYFYNLSLKLFVGQLCDFVQVQISIKSVSSQLYKQSSKSFLQQQIVQNRSCPMEFVLFIHQSNNDENNCVFRELENLQFYFPLSQPFQAILVNLSLLSRINCCSTNQDSKDWSMFSKQKFHTVLCMLGLKQLDQQVFLVELFLNSYSC